MLEQIRWRELRALDTAAALDASAHLKYVEERARAADATVGRFVILAN